MTIIGSTIDFQGNGSAAIRDVPASREWLSNKALAQNPKPVNWCSSTVINDGGLPEEFLSTEQETVSPLIALREIKIGEVVFH